MYGFKCVRIIRYLYNYCVHKNTQNYDRGDEGGDKTV